MEDLPHPQTSIDVKLDYMQRDVREMKADIKDIKQDFVSRREFVENTNNIKKEFTDANTLIREEFLSAVEAIKTDIALPKKIIYGMIGVIILAVFGAIIELVIRR